MAKSKRRRGQPTSLVLPENIKSWIEEQATTLGIPRTNVIIMCIKSRMDFEIATRAVKK